MEKDILFRLTFKEKIMRFLKYAYRWAYYYKSEIFPSKKILVIDVNSVPEYYNKEGSLEYFIHLKKMGYIFYTSLRFDGTRSGIKPPYMLDGSKVKQTMIDVSSKDGMDKFEQIMLKINKDSKRK